MCLRSIVAIDHPPQGRQRHGFWYELYLERCGLVKRDTYGTVFDGKVTKKFVELYGGSPNMQSSIKTVKMTNEELSLGDFGRQSLIDESFVLCLAYYKSILHGMVVQKREFRLVSPDVWNSFFGNVITAA